MLGTIHALVRISPEKARMCIKDLSDFLRRTLDHQSDLVRLSEELEIVQSYIRLEKARFGDRIQVSFDIDPAISEAFIPVFSLQPLVENAIKHGLSTKRNGGKLFVKVYQIDGNLKMLVEDNGVGIEEERLCKIRQFDGVISLEASSGTGIGLNNVHKRLQIAYGTSFGVKIESRLDYGTSVEATLPIICRSVS
jgi:LytS/YehU family sensor histidine kinase